MRWGFVLDQDACIGCHACTVACKAENDVPLGAFRTWVKWIEHGSFPDTKRSAAVLRCNHCEDAPCVEICPTVALHKRPDGIVDLDPTRCIGCASCLQACPYDAIYIDPFKGTAAKCHFCAHRMEVNLAPACVSVCPEQAIKVVDLDDERTRTQLSDLKATVRKPARGTKPQTYYLGADPIALDPLAVDGTRTLSHAEVPDPMPAHGTAEARAVYDVPRPREWGWQIAAYLWTKAIAAGALIAAAVFPDVGGHEAALGWYTLLAIVATGVLLVTDLHQPKRFYYLLIKPNFRSWLVRGAYVLGLHALLSFGWGFGLLNAATSDFMKVLSVGVGIMTAIYTAFLFAQARGRELWSEDHLLVVVLWAQALAAAAGLAWWFGTTGRVWAVVFLATTGVAYFVKPPTRAARRAHDLMVQYTAYWAGVLLAVLAVGYPPLALASFAFLDYVYIKAGQEVPLS